MKALVYRQAHTLDNFAIRLEDVAEPVLRDLDVLVEVRAIGVNPGEVFIRKTRSAEKGGRAILGWEFSGEVIGIGKGVDRFKIGDRVFGSGDMSRDGAWAERVAVDHRILAVIPQTLSFEDAASLPIGSLTAWEAMFRDQDVLPRGVDRVLIIGGAGAVGSLATQILKAKTQAFVISTASRPESKDWCAKMGADLVIDHSGDVADQLAKAKILEVDLVLSTAKTSDNIRWIAKLLRPFGHLSLTDGAAGLDPGALTMKSASLHTEMVFARILHGNAPHVQGHILETVLGFVLEEKVRPITTKLLQGLTADSMKTAHELLETRHTMGKIVIAY